MVYAERQWSNLAHQVAVIADQTVTSFVVLSMRESELIQPGMRYEMDVHGTMIWVQAIDPEEIGMEQTETIRREAVLMIESGEVFPPRTMGRIHAVFASARDVLYIPSRAVHTVAGQHHVYVLEEGMRRFRKVEIGLVGTWTTEIVSGLEEGEEVAV
jgi:hypothetical protein